MPGLEDTNFSQTVTYLCEHNEHGAMGIIINRPSELQLADILEQLEIAVTHHPLPPQPIYIGGPVQTDRGFILHSSESEWDSTLSITAEISVTTSRDILEAIAEGKGPNQTLIALGYAGWGSGQLEQEVSANAWLNSPAPIDVIFDTASEDRWAAAANVLGIDLNLLTGAPGHA